MAQVDLDLRTGTHSDFFRFSKFSLPLPQRTNGERKMMHDALP